MKDLVSTQRASIFALATSLAVFSALFVVPSGPPSSGLAWLGALAALAFLLVSTMVLLLRSGPPPSLVMVMPGAVVADVPGGGLDVARMRRRY